ncbi:hypothetical protein BHE90_016106 [Fusarium euwallaceae]|uniref:NmrA-like domain-containing protein n=3 Tax=Fusarium solani species complex TaxID=232080 RepID=A0A3M2RF18_9HYPO|nr:hypothetical protein CDV36_014714 [Fusarium kuroshium]RSL87543.1 hypothetical protein CDV31_016228 [Fusarium ambrosium]RTE69511.1 hypothetical protein BHE90_016106 [Fusarium euwallaceae]
MSRALLITGATGKQGGAVIDSLVAKQPSNFLLLAVTRNANSTSAKRLAAKSSSIKLVEGDLNALPSLFNSAKTLAGGVPLWGVYSVQAAVSTDKSMTLDIEVQQGKNLVDESIKAGVKHFVYSSVERGGDERSWVNPTPVPHFRTKHEVELHLRDAARGTHMGWTILRPTIFMDNLAPGFESKVLLTVLRDVLKEKPLQWVSAKDIGFFGAEAFLYPDVWNNKAIGLVSDELTPSQLDVSFKKVTGKPAPTTFGLLGRAVKAGVKELGVMVDWFRDEGYRADPAVVQKVHPGHQTLESWLKESSFVKG